MKNPETKFEPLKFQEKSPDEMIALSESFYLDMKRRRSVREFSDRSIPHEVIKNALLAAGTAPNGANMQPWHFVVVRDARQKQRVAEACTGQMWMASHDAYLRTSIYAHQMAPLTSEPLVNMASPRT